MSPLLEVRDLCVEFPTRHARPPIRALDGISIDLPAGTTLGVVGASGAGKTTLGRAVLGLISRVAGTIRFDGRAVPGPDRASELEFRRRAQPVFQDPRGSLNPRKTVAGTLGEVLAVHGAPREVRRDRVDELLERVGLHPDVRRSRPHELSGGQLQRVGIARALAVEPELMILDEPVSALDVSVQARILNLLLRLQSELALTFLFIAHDLAVVHRMSDRMLVLHQGRVVEEGTPDMVLRHPTHPHTRALVEAVLPVNAGDRPSEWKGSATAPRMRS